MKSGSSKVGELVLSARLMTGETAKCYAETAEHLKIPNEVNLERCLCLTTSGNLAGK